MIVITGSVEVPAEHRAEAVRLACEHSARSRKEHGCIAHNCSEDLEAPGRIFFFEKWESEGAVRAHFAVPASGQFIKAISVLASGPPQIDIYSAAKVEVATG